jgi:hypothetical protein
MLFIKSFLEKIFVSELSKIIEKAGKIIPTLTISASEPTKTKINRNTKNFL